MTTAASETAVALRPDLRPADVAAIRDILASTGFFYDYEIATACELAEDRLAKGEKSEYQHLLADCNGRVAGYACFGPIACTDRRYDLYWIGVHQDFRNLKIGRKLLRETEKIIAQKGGRRIYVETSGRPQYAPTRHFYLSNGYRTEAELPDYYADGDPKVIFINDFELKANP